MFDPKIDKNTITESKQSLEPAASLEGVKGIGDKSALLDELVTEGKLSTQPYQGPQAVLKEGPVAVSEIIQGAITGAKTEAIEAVQALPADMKVSLMERVIEERPNLSVKEIKATCAVLEIDPEKFIKTSTDAITKDTINQIQEAKTARDLNNVVLSLFYKDTESVSIVDKNIETSIGKSISDQFANKTSDIALKLSMDLALLGQSSDPYLDLQRVLTLLTIEKRQAEKRAVPLSTAENIHIEKMQQALDEAARILDKQSKFPLGDNDGGGFDAFYSALKEAQNQFANLNDSKPWWVTNPGALRSILLSAIIFVLLFIFQDKEHPVIYWIITLLVGIWLYKFGNIKQLEREQRLRKSYLDDYQTIAEQRAAAKSAKLKK